MKAMSIVTGMTLGLLAACGGSSTSGTVRGTALNPLEAVFLVRSEPEGEGQSITVVMGDTANRCDKIRRRVAPKNTTTLLMSLSVTDSSGTLQPLTTGAYDVETHDSEDTGNVVYATYDKTDGSCISVFNQAPTGTGGKVNLTNLSVKEGGTASGTFDISFGADRLKGSFHALYCDASTTTDDTACE